MFGLEIRTMQAGKYKLLVQIDMEELFSKHIMTTYGYLAPIDVLKQLEQCIDNDIELDSKIQPRPQLTSNPTY